MEDLLDYVRAYRTFLVQIGGQFKEVRDKELYHGQADSFIDLVKSPEVGFSVSEVNTLIKMYDIFSMLEPNDLPSHHSMKLMTTKKVDMNLLESAQTLTVTDFKELLKDEETGTQERTYKYEVIKRVVETNAIKKVYGEELDEAIKTLKKEEHA